MAQLYEAIVRIGFKIAAGGYCMRPSDPTLPRNGIQMDRYERNDSNEEPLTESERLQRGFGEYPYRLFHNHPKPKYFNTLATNVARAAYSLPKIRSISFYITAVHEDRDFYRGRGFFFRSGNDSTYSLSLCHRMKAFQGIDRQVLLGLRTEWVFQCPAKQLQWEEPVQVQQN